MLRVLGELSLAGTKISRPKPLLLLAFLSLEGRKDRKLLAHLFWPDAADPLNNLSVTLGRLRQGAPAAVSSDATFVWTHLETDAAKFEREIRLGQLEEALELYRGPLLQGVLSDDADEGADSDCGHELVEWGLARRALFGDSVRAARLALAERWSARGRSSDSIRLAEAAFTTSEASSIEPDDLLRLHALLKDTGSPIVERVRREAVELGIELKIELGVSEIASRARARQAILGREGERARLETLAVGEWAWVRGAPGMGKTALLKSLSGHYLPARQGRPYATLEPIVGHHSDRTQEVLLRVLCRLEGTILIDGWQEEEGMDDESRTLLERLRPLRPALRVIVASRSAAPNMFDFDLELRPLNAESLRNHDGAWQATGGYPPLVDAFLRGAALENELGTRLEQLGADARRIYQALALLPTPNLPLVRDALAFGVLRFAAPVNQLVASGLIEPSGAVRARAVALETIRRDPANEAEIALRLARQLTALEALPFFALARSYWDLADMTAVAESYIASARAALRQGSPQQAVEILVHAPDTVETMFWRARGLERCGRYPEALRTLVGQVETPETLALRATLCWRLGHQAEAHALAQKAASEGNLEVRAEALQVIGNLLMQSGDADGASDALSRSAALFLAVGLTERRAEVLNDAGVARAIAGEPTETAFVEALEAASADLLLTSRVYLNIGLVHKLQDRPADAELAYRKAFDSATSSGALDVSARAWNNIGALYHSGGRTSEARTAYLNALEFARSATEPLVQGTVMANLAELDADPAAAEEAFRLLEMNGYDIHASQLRQDLSFLKR